MKAIPPNPFVEVDIAAVPLVLAALFGMSRDARLRRVGAAADPVVGPATTQFAD